MAIIRGTDGNNNLFGTDGRDRIFGKDGVDTIVGNGGRDDITGNGTIRAGAGADLYHSFNYFEALDPSSVTRPVYNVQMGDGADEILLDGGSITPVEMGDGKDTVYLVQSNTEAGSGFGANLGDGADTAYVMGESNTGLHLGFSNFGLETDHRRDKIHFDGNGEGLSLNYFGTEDLLIIYDTDLDFTQMMLRTFDLHGNATITLENDTTISMGMAKEFLSADMFRFKTTKLKLEHDVYVGLDEQRTTVNIGSSADDVMRAIGDQDLYLGAGDDRGIGNAMANTIFGQFGDDQISGGLGNDILAGNAGNDVVSGGAGRDTISGDKGINVLLGGKGKDTITTASNADTVRGGAGQDTIHLSENLHVSFTDTEARRDIWGGGGSDTFILSRDASFYTVIRDFTPGVDKLDIRALNVFDVNQFFENSYQITPGDTNFRPVPGILLYDADYLILAGLDKDDLSINDLIY